MKSKRSQSKIQNDAPRLYSYVLRYDNGAAPNPFWGICTLTICKPDIRRVANEGDWIVGTGSKNSPLKDGNIYNLSDSVVYAMKVTKKLSLEEYDTYVKDNCPRKVPRWFSGDYRLRIGDCIYDYSKGTHPKLRNGVHTIESMDRDLRGGFALISKHFYYFGEEPRLLPQNLKHIIRRGQKHLVFDDSVTMTLFENWINQFNRNTIHADPQLRYEFDLMPSQEYRAKCSIRHRTE